MLQITFFFIAIGPIFYFATNIYPNIRPPSETTSEWMLRRFHLMLSSFYLKSFFHGSILTFRLTIYIF